MSVIAYVRVIHRITRKSRYLANVAYDVTMCFCIHYVHYWNTVSIFNVDLYIFKLFIRKIVVLKLRTLL